jgi:predicted neutral ceramidase superfamily lipid hydrolase
MKINDGIIVLLVFATMFGLLVILYPFNQALTGWAWLTIMGSTTIIASTVITIFRDIKRGATFKQSTHTNFNSRPIASSFLFIIGIVLSHFYVFIFPPLFGIVCGIIMSLPLIKREGAS